MQLILETEPTLDIRGDMSVVEGSLDEKFVGNGECDIDLKNTEYSIGNLEESSNSKSSTETVNVNNDSNLDSDLKKTLDGGDVMLLDNRETFINNGCDSVDSTCANDGNNDIQELHKDELTNYEALEDPISKQTNSDYEEQVCALEDNIDRIKDSHIDEPEAMDVPDTENNVEEVNKTECNLIDSSLINENNTVLSSEITVAPQPTENKDDALNSPPNITEPNIVNEISPCHDSVTSEEKLQSIEFNTNIDIERPKSIKIEEKSTNDISEIQELSKEVQESMPMETKDGVNVEEIENVVVQEIDIAHSTDLNIEVPIAAKEITSATSDIGQEINTDTCIETVIKKDTDTIEVKDEVDIEKLKDSVEETKIITCDISSNNSLKESASKDLKVEVFGDDVMCITDDSKMDTYVDKEILNKGTSIPIELNDEIEDLEEVKDVKENIPQADIPNKSPVPPVPADSPKKPVICKLSNTLDILSDDEEEPPKETQTKVDSQTTEKESTQSQSINIEDDDDIMLIDEDVPTESKVSKTLESIENQEAPNPDSKTDQETGEECNKKFDDLISNSKEKESPPPADTINMDVDIKEKPIEKEPEVVKQEKPLLPENFLKSAKKNLADMTREDLEEFCILKIVESIVDRSSLSDIKTKLKTMAQNIEVYRKKAMTLTKQNRDLQVVLKSVQEEQKKMTDLPITPLKITRSVGMQVLMTDKVTARRKTMATPLAPPTLNTSNNKQNIRIPAQQTPRTPKPTTSNQSIPVPRLVPANSPAIKSPTPMPPIQPTSAPGKITLPNGIKNQTPQKAPEKRPHNRIQSVTVDLTDDEPPAKLNPRNSPAPPVRLVPPQNLLAPQRQPFPPVVNSPRKVYIPISGPQSQAIRAGQTIMLKPVPGIRPRCAPPQVSRNTTPVRRVTSGRHPAPLPDVMKQYQPPNWKALPPAPDLRLSKVENGIVISWKIEGYQEDSYEEIASYQLYAYQETTSPPSTSLWKKIGDVKALPLPMACTLTQFMAGFKYYFAVRAVDVKSRLGPFSLPGSILLLNKL